MKLSKEITMRYTPWYLSKDVMVRASLLLELLFSYLFTSRLDSYWVESQLADT